MKNWMSKLKLDKSGQIIVDGDDLPLPTGFSYPKTKRVKLQNRRTGEIVTVTMLVKPKSAKN